MELDEDGLEGSEEDVHLVLQEGHYDLEVEGVVHDIIYNGMKAVITPTNLRGR